MAQDRKNSPRLLFSTKGVDFSDDASIEAFATRVWEVAAGVGAIGANDTALQRNN